MFYNNPDITFKITGVFYVERGAKSHQTLCRRHSALAYRIHGTSTFTQNSKHLYATAGDLLYIPTGASYRRESTEETLIIIRLRCFGDEESDLQIIENATELEPLFRKIISVWEEEGSGIHNRSMQLLYTIFDFLETRNRHDRNSVPDVITQGVQLLQKHYRDPTLKISDLAKACYISDGYFRKVFQEYYGEQPSQYLLNLRFAHACQLLTSGYYTQKEIAALSGFADVKYFRTAFRKRFHMTLSEYCNSNTT